MKHLIKFVYRVIIITYKTGWDIRAVIWLYIMYLVTILYLIQLTIGIIGFYMFIYGYFARSNFKINF